MNQIDRMLRDKITISHTHIFDGTGVNIEVPSDADDINIILDGVSLDRRTGYTIKLKNPTLKDIIIYKLPLATHTVNYSYKTARGIDPMPDIVDFAQLITDL